jgi:hypothetical protein
MVGTAARISFITLSAAVNLRSFVIQPLLYFLV